MGFTKELLNQFAPEADCIKPMKIWKLPDGKEYMFSELCDSKDYFAEVKKDGYWYQFEKTDNYNYLFSRNTSQKTKILTDKIENVPHIQEAFKDLPSGTILIGEIYYPNKTSKDVTRIMGCLAEKAIQRQAEEGLIHFYLHDVIKYNGINIMKEGAYNRYLVLKAIWDKFNLSRYDYLELADIYLENIQEKTSEALACGEEGMVLKKKNAPYSPDKRPAWDTIKIKKVDTLDAICIGFCDATMEYTGKLDVGSNYDGKDVNEWQYWAVLKRDSLNNCDFKFDHIVPINTTEVIRSPSFVTVPVTKGFYYGWKTAIRIGAYDEERKIREIGTVASGLNDVLRESFSTNPEEYMNKVVLIECMEKNHEDYTLRHAFFKGFREDKDPEDCLIQNIF